MSRQVLYVKYNSTREPKYRITTEICRDADGQFVLKRADSDVAKLHLDAIRENGLALQNYYTEGIQMISSETTEYGLRFPFISGQTLAAQISMQRFDKDEFISRVNKRLDTVLSVKDQYCVPFHMTEDFGAMFGSVELDGVPALNPANIDCLFSNFIENDEAVYCIDCEWVYHFPIPLNFIKYRILLYLYVTQAHAEMEGVRLEEMLGWFNLSKEECEIYRQMDDRFQQSVHGENRKYIYTDNYRKMNQSLDYLNQSLDCLKQVIENQKQVIENQEMEIRKIIYDKDAAISQLTMAYQTIENSTFWRMTAPARKCLDAIKRRIQKNEVLFLNLRMAKDIAQHGYKYSMVRRQAYLETQGRIRNISRWPTKEELELQRSESFPRDIVFSILVPLYNTPEQFLREMIESVQGQTYPKWELCLADGSNTENENVGRICHEYTEKDSRIRYQKLEKNLGISGNTNACIDMATGNFIALFDHDDVLHPSALYELMKAICGQNADYVYTDEATFESPDRNKISTLHFKPDFAPDNLLANNYICHFSAFSADLLKKAGRFRPEYDGSQDHDMILRLTAVAENVVHVPKVLYWWRSHPQSVAQDIGAKEYAIDAAKRAVRDFLWDFKHTRVEVLSTRAFPTIFQIVYPLRIREKVSIIIPNKDHIDDLKRCIDSILEKTTYGNYEIIVVENNSVNQETFDYYKTLSENARIKILHYPDAFNFSKINNWAVNQCDARYVVLMNNDTEIINSDWLENMMMYAQRDDVGAVGAKLYFPDGRIQHAGIILKLGADRVAGHSHYGAGKDNLGYMGRLCYAQDVSAVTAACLMVKREKYIEVGGMDESFAVAFNDVDFCLMLRGKGYLNIFTPFAELYHYESASRGMDTGENKQRFQTECVLFKEKWAEVLDRGDPYYNPNFSLDSSMFELM